MPYPHALSWKQARKNKTHTKTILATLILTASLFLVGYGEATYQRQQEANHCFNLAERHAPNAESVSWHKGICRAFIHDNLITLTP